MTLWFTDDIAGGEVFDHLYTKKQKKHISPSCALSLTDFLQGVAGPHTNTFGKLFILNRNGLNVLYHVEPKITSDVVKVKA